MLAQSRFQKLNIWLTSHKTKCLYPWGPWQSTMWWAVFSVWRINNSDIHNLLQKHPIHFFWLSVNYIVLSKLTHKPTHADVKLQSTVRTPSQTHKQKIKPPHTITIQTKHSISHPGVVLDFQLPHCTHSRTGCKEGRGSPAYCQTNKLSLSCRALRGVSQQEGAEWKPQQLTDVWKWKWKALLTLSAS